MGYAFINFVDPKTIITFCRHWFGRRWQQYSSRKRCELAYGRIQGKAALIEHFQHSRTLLSSPPHCRPMLFSCSPGDAQGEPEPFPPQQGGVLRGDGSGGSGGSDGGSATEGGEGGGGGMAGGDGSGITKSVADTFQGFDSLPPNHYATIPPIPGGGGMWPMSAHNLGNLGPSVFDSPSYDSGSSSF